MNQAELFAIHPEYKHPPSGPRPKPPPAKLKLTRPEPAERDVLSSILAALAFFPCVAWFQRMNSGAYTVGEGAARRFVRFGFEGCPDIIGMLKPARAGEPGRFLSIEVKRPSGRTTEAQAAFLERVRGLGGIAFVARSVSDLREHLGS